MDVDGGRKFSRGQLCLQGGDDGVEALLVLRVRDDVDPVPVGVLDCLQVELQRRLSTYVVVVGGLLLKRKAPKNSQSHPVAPVETKGHRRIKGDPSTNTGREGWVKAEKGGVSSKHATKRKSPSHISFKPAGHADKAAAGVPTWNPQGLLARHTPRRLSRR